jgi:hypothetical protein
MISPEILKNRHPAVQQIARYFDHEHLIDGDIDVCGRLAEYMITRIPDGPELTAGLRKLLEAKDCFVRAALPG